MGLELFHEVPAGAIEMLFDDQNQPLFKRADLGKYLGIRNTRDNFKDFPSHYTRLRSEIEGVGSTNSLGRTKNPHDIFINLDGSIEIAAQSKKCKTVTLIKWLTKKGIEKIQEHQQAITDHDNQIQALDFRNEKHQRLLKKKMQYLDCLLMTYKTITMKFRPFSMIMLHCKHKRMSIRLSYKNVRIPSPVLGPVMFLMQKISVKTTLSSLYGNIQHLPMINIMTCHIMLRGYNDVKGMLS